MMYWVIEEGENLTSWAPEEDGQAEFFETEQAAEKRACELAEKEPGKAFFIATMIASVKCGVTDPKVVRAE